MGIQYKVIFLISALNTGGAESVLIDIINNVDRKRLKPILCVLYDGELLNKVNDDVIIYKNIAKNARDPNILSKLIQIFQTHSPEIVEIFGRDIAGLYGRIAAKLTNTLVIVQSLHLGAFTWRDEPKRGMLHLINRFCDSWTNAFISVSNSQSEFYQSMGLPKSRMFVIHNGVDSNLFTPASETDKKFLDILGIPAGAPVIGRVANFGRLKRHDVIIEAMAIVQKSFPNARCLLLGDGPLRYEAERMVQDLGLSNNIMFLGVKDQIVNYLKILDVFVLTSETESFSKAIVEAMCVGIPVVSTECGGPGEIVVPGETGFLVPVGDSSGLAEKIIRLLKDPKLAKQMGRSGCLRAIKNYSLQNMVLSREKLLFNLLEKNAQH